MKYESELGTTKENIAPINRGSRNFRASLVRKLEESLRLPRRENSAPVQIGFYKKLRVAVGLTAALSAFVLAYAGAQPSQATATISSRIPTPGPGAMTVYEIENKNLNDLVIRGVITNTAGISIPITNTVKAGTVANFHLRDFPNVPSPFEGSMTLEPEQPISSTVVSYDYLPPIPVDWACWADIDGDGTVTVFDVQRVASAWGTNLNSSGYYGLYDLTDGKGNNYRDGRIDILDVQIAAGQWPNKCIPTP